MDEEKLDSMCVESGISDALRSLGVVQVSAAIFGGDEFKLRMSFQEAPTTDQYNQAIGYIMRGLREVNTTSISSLLGDNDRAWSKINERKGLFNGDIIDGKNPRIVLSIGAAGKSLHQIFGGLNFEEVNTFEDLLLSIIEAAHTDADISQTLSRVKAEIAAQVESGNTLMEVIHSFKEKNSADYIKLNYRINNLKERLKADQDHLQYLREQKERIESLDTQQDESATVPLITISDFDMSILEQLEKVPTISTVSTIAEINLLIGQYESAIENKKYQLAKLEARLQLLDRRKD